MYKSWGSKLLLDIILFICQLKLFKSPRLEKYSNCCSNKFSPRDSANLLFLLYVCTNKINFGWGKKYNFLVVEFLVHFCHSKFIGPLISAYAFSIFMKKNEMLKFKDFEQKSVWYLWTMSFYPSLCSIETSSRRPSLLYL